MVYLGQDTLGLVMLLEHPSTFQRMLDIGESTQMVHLVWLGWSWVWLYQQIWV